ncbi:MAG: ParB N-terminal domain-containing protein [Bacteroidetes bacterium]|nr:ParB N-terminal domain-containing protein [Bacteroidota bacterium]
MREKFKQYKTQTVKREYIKPVDYNPRKIEEENLLALQTSIDEFGLVEPLIWNKRTGNLISGHQRLKILDGENAQNIECIVVNLSMSKEKLLNIQMNNEKTQGEWDYEKLNNQLLELAETEEELLEQLKINELMAIEKIIKETNNDEIEFTKFYVLVKCNSETEQKKTIEKLIKEGYDVEARQM